MHVHIHQLTGLKKLCSLTLKNCVAVGQSDFLSVASELRSLHLLGHMWYKMNGTDQVTERPEGLASSSLHELHWGRIDAKMPLMNFSGLPQLTHFFLDVIDLRKFRDSHTDVEALVSWLTTLPVSIADRCEVNVTGNETALQALMPLSHTLAGKSMTVIADCLDAADVTLLSELGLRSLLLRVEGRGFESDAIHALKSVRHLSSIRWFIHGYADPPPLALAILHVAARKSKPFVLEFFCGKWPDAANAESDSSDDDDVLDTDGLRQFALLEGRCESFRVQWENAKPFIPGASCVEIEIF